MTQSHITTDHIIKLKKVKTDNEHIKGNLFDLAFTSINPITKKKTGWTSLRITLKTLERLNFLTECELKEFTSKEVKK